MKTLDLIGKRFGSLVVLFKTKEIKDRHRLLMCKCDCGKFHKVLAKNLMNKNTRSCGCLKHSYIWETRIKRGFKYKIYKDKRGYLSKRINGKPIYLHRLIKKVTDNKIHVHHIDKNKSNNNPSNLVAVNYKIHAKLEWGWEFIDNKWWKECRGCKNFLEVNKDNFYQRNGGRFLPRCKNCCKNLGKHI